MSQNIAVKVVMLGSTQVGKTTLVTRWTEERYDPNQAATVGAAFKVVTIEMADGKSYDLNIWDTAGQDQFKSTTSIYCRDAKAAMLVFDLTQRQSYDDIPGWINTLKEKADVPFILVGNKCDLESQREVTFDEATEFARSHDTYYFETSALTNYNVDEAFNELSNMAVRELTNVNGPKSETVISDQQEQPKTVDLKQNTKQETVNNKKSGCC